MTNTDRIIKNYWKVLEGDQRGTEIRAEFAVGKLLLIGKNCELMTFLLGVLQTPQIWQSGTTFFPAQDGHNRVQR